MKLSTAAVIIAAGTSNVFSPNVVLAGKTGKLAPKASKATPKASKAKAVTVKAHPSLSYGSGSGSGSYSMSIGPPPPPSPPPSPPQDGCPCWSQTELNEVTADNVESGKSCQVYEGVGEANAVYLESFPPDKRLLEVGPSSLALGDGTGNFQCSNSEGTGMVNPVVINEEEYNRCFQDIEDRCNEIGIPPVVVNRCPCFTAEDLLVVTPENVDEAESDCAGQFLTTLSTVDGQMGTPFGYKFQAGAKEETGEWFCLGAPAPGVEVESFPLSGVVYLNCVELLEARCEAVGVPTDI